MAIASKNLLRGQKLPGSGLSRSKRMRERTAVDHCRRRPNNDDVDSTPPRDQSGLPQYVDGRICKSLQRSEDLAL